MNEQQTPPVNGSITPSQKWDFYFASVIEKLLAPKGYRKRAGSTDPVASREHLQKEEIHEVIKESIQIHRNFQTDLKAVIQMKIAKERAKMVLDPLRPARIKVWEEAFALVDLVTPANVKEAPRAAN